MLARRNASLGSNEARSTRSVALMGSSPRKHEERGPDVIELTQARGAWL